MPLMLAIKLVQAFVMKYWKGLLVGLLIAACAWIFFDWRGQRAEIRGLKAELKVSHQMSEAWRETAREQSVKALEAAVKRAEFEARLEELLANPPTVTIYEDAEPEIHEIIVEAKTCDEAVIRLGEKLKGLLDE